MPCDEPGFRIDQHDTLNPNASMVRYRTPEPFAVAQDSILSKISEFGRARLVREIADLRLAECLKRVTDEFYI